MALHLFQNCDVPEKVGGTFDPELDLNDDGGGGADIGHLTVSCQPHLREFGREVRPRGGEI